MITCEFSSMDTAAGAMNQLDVSKSKVVTMAIEHWFNTTIIMPTWQLTAREVRKLVLELLVSLCVYLRSVAVSCATEEEITLPTTHAAESIRNKLNRHTPKKKKEWKIKKKRPCLVQHQLLLSCCYFLLNQDEQSKEEKKQKQQRNRPWKPQ